MIKTIALFISCICIFLISWNYSTKKSGFTDVQIWVMDEVKQISNNLETLIRVGNYKKNYHEARKHYKRIELFIEYANPRESKYFINGPLVLKHDEENGKIQEPKGFQKIEELIFTEENKDSFLIINETNELLHQFKKLEQYYATLNFEEGLLIDMCQLQLYRIASLNLNGYDATISRNFNEETAFCFEGIYEICKRLIPEKKDERNYTFDELAKTIKLTTKYLRSKDENTLERLSFITDFILPLNKQLLQFKSACGIKKVSRKQALNLDEEFLFGNETFNSAFFSIYYSDSTHLKEQAALGKLLFYDPILSGNNKRSCTSCHNPDLYFTDGKEKSTSYSGNSTLKRNSPSLLNVIYQKAFFYDGRAYQLEQQLFDVIHNQEEMGSDLNLVAEKLGKSKEYQNIFSQAFKGTADTVITEYAIKKAISEYEKTIVSFNSKFDSYLKGNKKALSAKEIKGYNIFSGKALCGSCHFFPVFNGTVPPFFSDSEFEVLGVPSNKNNQIADEDQGREKITGFKAQHAAFKTPGLRNVEFTAPYMHNGIYKTLEEVVEFYHKGGGKGFGLNFSNQTLPFDSLQLSAEETENLILFLKSLSDYSIPKNKPVRLPEFEKDPELNFRRSGGDE